MHYFYATYSAYAPIECGNKAGKVCYTVVYLYIGISLMFTPKSLDEIAAKLSDAVANSPIKDFEKNARALLTQGFAKLDLVTREEFDVQAQLLSRTQEKLAELEARVTALEAQQK